MPVVLVVDGAANRAFRRFRTFRRFVLDADGCVSVADVKDVGSVALDAEDEGPPEGRDDEDEGASSSSNNFCIGL